MIFCNFRKILMIFPDLGLQRLPQVFNIFENVFWVLSGRLGDQRKIIFGLTTAIRVKSVSKVG